jgi:predicted Holliday junction resolvase-like endonuclease
MGVINERGEGVIFIYHHYSLLVMFAEIITNLLKLEFDQKIQATALVLLVLFVFLSLIPRCRLHCMKLAGLFTTLLLAIYAHNWFVYAAAILIVGTFITNKEFLENIAAILQGAAREVLRARHLSEKEQEEKIKGEMMEEEVQEKKQKTVKKKPSAKEEVERVQVAVVSNKRIQEYRAVEQLTLNKLEMEYGQKISRYVGFKDENLNVDFDGLLRGKNYDIIFEIKFTDSAQLLSSLIPRFKSIVDKYSLITGRATLFHLIVVSDKLKSDDCVMESIVEKNKIYLTNVLIKVYSYADIGYKPS